MYLPVGSAGGMDHCNDGARPRQPAEQKGGGTASLVVAAFMRPWPVAFRNAVKTGPVSEQGRPPERPERVSKRRENRRLAGQERSQEPIVMGSWLFSSNACNISSCEPWTHPGAHRLVYVRRPNELNAFRNAMKSAPAKGGAAVCPTHLDAFRKALNTVADS